MKRSEKIVPILMILVMLVSCQGVPKSKTSASSRKSFLDEHEELSDCRLIDCFTKSKSTAKLLDNIQVKPNKSALGTFLTHLNEGKETQVHFAYSSKDDKRCDAIEKFVVPANLSLLKAIDQVCHHLNIAYRIQRNDAIIWVYFDFGSHYDWDLIAGIEDLLYLHCNEKFFADLRASGLSLERFLSKIGVPIVKTDYFGNRSVFTYEKEGNILTCQTFRCLYPKIENVLKRLSYLKKSSADVEGNKGEEHRDSEDGIPF